MRRNYLASEKRSNEAPQFDRIDEDEGKPVAKFFK